MITPSDPEYAEAREYKEGRRQMVSPFAEVADWIALEFSVERPLQVRLDHPGKPIPPDFRFRSKKYRLDIVFEHEEVKNTFHEPEFHAFDEEKQACIAAFFADAVERHRSAHTGALGKLLPFRSAKVPSAAQMTEHGLFVIFSAFDHVARQEANSSIPQREIDELQAQLAPLGIWKIFRLGAGVTFMFETDAQAEAALGNGAYETCRDSYWTLLQPHDRYGYFAQTPIWDKCDSRETFERDYKGSWFNYTR